MKSTLGQIQLNKLRDAFKKKKLHMEGKVPFWGGGGKKQAENGLQSRSSENGSVALWIEIAVILNWR